MKISKEEEDEEDPVDPLPEPMDTDPIDLPGIYSELLLIRLLRFFLCPRDPELVGLRSESLAVFYLGYPAFALKLLQEPMESDPCDISGICSELLTSVPAPKIFYARGIRNYWAFDPGPLRFFIWDIS